MAEKKNAMQVVHRGQNLPFVEYDDGSIGWGVPQVYYDLKDSWNQFTNAAEAARGIPHTPEESFPRQQDAILAGAAMAGSGLGHLGLRGRVAGSVAGAERAEASGLKPPSNYYELYHGTAAPEQFSEFSLRNVRNKHEPGVFFTDKPDVASNYARASADDSFADGRVFRAYLPKDDVMDYEMGKARGVDPIMDARGDALNLDKKAIRFIGPKGESTYMVLSPSALRYQDQIAQGLASNAVQRAEASSGLPSHSAGTGSTPVRAYHSTYADFDRFDKAKSEEFGVHFGAPDQVNSRLVEKGGLEKRDGFENARVLPVDLQIKNPIDVRDLANWSPQDLAGQLMQKGVRFTRDEIAALDRANRRTGNTIIENALERAGYDALRYQNLSEGPGSSYAVWKPGTVKSATTGETLFSNPKEAAPVGVLPAMANAGEQRSIRAYHGTVGDLEGGKFSRSRAGGNYDNEVSQSGVSFDTNPAVASRYADDSAMMPEYRDYWKNYQSGAPEFAPSSPGHRAAVYPVDITGRGATIDKSFGQLGPTEMGRRIEALKQQGYDYATFPSNAGGGHQEINVWRPGTVRSATTGETLFSNPKDVSPAGFLATGQDAQPMQDFDTALAQLQGIIVDLDGDGVPDAQIPQALVPQMPSNAMQAGPAGPQAPQPNAMAAFPEMVANNPRGWGNAPPLDPAQLRNADPMAFESPVVRNALEYGPMPAQGFVDQLDRSADALSDATDDPSLANVTNAGVQTAFALGRPVVGAAILGAGMLEGARRDYAPDVFGGPAEAQSLNRKQRREQEMQDREAARQREGEAARIRAESEARRAEAAAAAETKIKTDKEAAALGEYNAAVGRAESARDTELARKRRFSETEMGKVYDRAGGAVPIAAGVGMGAAGRLAHGNTFAGRWIAPVIEGAAGTIAATSMPLLYDYQTDPDNPEKAAYQAYARELPPGHPRKQEFADYANTLPDRNPVQELAQEQFFSPKRIGMSAGEGALGGLGGSTIVGVGARAGRGLMGLFKGKPNAMQPGAASAAPAEAVAPKAQVLIRDANGVLRDRRGRYAGMPEE